MGIVTYYMPHIGDGSGYLNPVRRTDIRDKPRSGRPASATSESDVAALKPAVEQDARCTVEKISHLCSTNSSSVFHIMTNVVKLRKVCARWLPHLLTADQEWCASKLLDMYNNADQKRVNEIVTGDETRVYFYLPEGKKKNQGVDR